MAKDLKLNTSGESFVKSHVTLETQVSAIFTEHRVSLSRWEYSHGTVMDIRKTLFDMKLDLFHFFYVSVICAVLFASNLTRAELDERQRCPVVQTETGAVVGKVENLPHGKSVYEYLGIPYAEPPVGGLRFIAPKPVKPWSGIKSATEFGASCVQQESLPFPEIEKTYSGMSL